MSKQGVWLESILCYCRLKKTAKRIKSGLSIHKEFVIESVCEPVRLKHWFSHTLGASLQSLLANFDAP